MKVVILHPPLYPVNHVFFNLLGKYVDLVVYSFGSHPALHSTWKVESMALEASSYRLEVLDGHTDLDKKAVNYKLQMNPLLLKYVFREKPDVVISVAFWMPSFYAACVKGIGGFKLFILTDAIIETEKEISKLRYYLRKFVCWACDGVITASSLTDEYIRSLSLNTAIKQSSHAIDVVTWGEEIDSLPSKETLRGKLNIPMDKTILLGVGTFTPLKNWEIVLDQMMELSECYFLLIGEGELKDNYLSYVKKNRLESRVRIISRKQGLELKEYYKSSDIFLFPSLRDTFGYVIPEALSSSLPVVCASTCGASTLIESGVNGYVVPPRSNFVSEIRIVIERLSEFSLCANSKVNTYTLDDKAIELAEYFNSFSKERR